MKKKMIPLIAISILSLAGIITGSFFLYHHSTNTVQNDETSTWDIVELTDIQDFYALTDGFVYFTRDTCETCRQFRPILEKVLKQEGIVVSLFDTDYFRENALQTEEELQTIFRDYQIEHVPAVVSLKDSALHSVFGIGSISQGSEDEIETQLRDYFCRDRAPQTTDADPFLPQYQLTIGLFLLSVVMLLCVLLFLRRFTKPYRMIVVAESICLAVLFVVTIRSTTDALDVSLFTGHPVMTILNFAGIVFSLAGAAILLAHSGNPMVSPLKQACILPFGKAGSSSAPARGTRP